LSEAKSRPVGNKYIMIKKFFEKSLTTLSYLALAPSAYAQGSFNIDIDSQVKSRVSVNEDLGSFVTRVFSAVVLVAGIATFIYMVYGGVQWIMSGGEKDKLNEAKAKITQAIVGLAVVASAWAIFKLVDYFFGIGIAN